MSDHVLGDENRDEGLTIVDAEGLSDEVWCDHGATAPSLDGLLIAGLNGCINLSEKLLINVGSFFQ